MVNLKAREETWRTSSGTVLRYSRYFTLSKEGQGLAPGCRSQTPGRRFRDTRESAGLPLRLPCPMKHLTVAQAVAISCRHVPLRVPLQTGWAALTSARPNIWVICGNKAPTKKKKKKEKCKQQWASVCRAKMSSVNGCQPSQLAQQKTDVNYITHPVTPDIDGTVQRTTM